MPYFFFLFFNYFQRSLNETSSIPNSDCDYLKDDDRLGILWVE